MHERIQSIKWLGWVFEDPVSQECVWADNIFTDNSTEEIVTKLIVLLGVALNATQLSIHTRGFKLGKLNWRLNSMANFVPLSFKYNIISINLLIYFIKAIAEVK